MASNISEYSADILIVDDTPDNLTLLRKTLSDNGYRVRPALSGEQALKSISQKRPDLILLDIMMPTMDGFEVCRRLQTNPTMRAVPIIFLTALGEEEDEEKGFALGAVDYITKPFKPSLVLARVKTHLELQKAYRNQKELLEKTVTGVISLLADILALAYPAIFSRVSRVRDIVSQLSKHCKTSTWQYKLAGLLSQVGCITLSTETFTKLLEGKELSDLERSLAAKHPQVGCELISKIPHLKKIGTIISLQNEPENSPLLQPHSPEVREGVRILKIALAYERFVSCGLSQARAIAKLREQPQMYDMDTIDFLEGELRMQSKQVQSRAVHLEELKPGMTVVGDIVTRDNKVLLADGMILNKPAVSLLHYYAQSKELTTDLFEVVIAG